MIAGSPSVADAPTREFHRQIADPDIFCGGGSVAALAAAGAASTALLVMRLNMKRRSNAGIRDQIERAIAETESAINAFHTAADEDIAILDKLLVAHRAARSGQGNERYLAALANAAESPLRMGERAVALLELIAGQLTISTRFTISDLGAAAVLAEGACRAALLTAEVNIALLSEADGADPELASAMRRRRAATYEMATTRAESIEGLTRAMILGRNANKGTE